MNADLGGDGLGPFRRIAGHLVGLLHVLLAKDAGHFEELGIKELGQTILLHLRAQCAGEAEDLVFVLFEEEEIGKKHRLQALRRDLQAVFELQELMQAVAPPDRPLLDPGALVHHHDGRLLALDDDVFVVTSQRAREQGRLHPSAQASLQHVPALHVRRVGHLEAGELDGAVGDPLLEEAGNAGDQGVVTRMDTHWVDGIDELPDMHEQGLELAQALHIVGQVENHAGVVQQKTVHFVYEGAALGGVLTGSMGDLFGRILGKNSVRSWSRWKLPTSP